FTYLRGIAFLPSPTAAGGAGDLIVSDEHTIKRISLQTKQVTTIAGQSNTGFVDGECSKALFNNPFGVAIDFDENILVADWGNQCIRKITLATSTVTTLAGSGGVQGNTDGTLLTAKFTHPFGIAVAPGSACFIAPILLLMVVCCIVFSG